MEPIEFRIGSAKSPIVISLKEFGGKKLIDIRKYYKESKDTDEIIPTRKGISLTGQQLSLVLDGLNEHTETIVNFYSSSLDLNLKRNLNISLGSPMGRLFDFSYENDTTNVTIDKKLTEKISEDHSALLVNLLLLFHKSLLDCLDEKQDVDMVLDSLSHRIGGAIC